MSRPPEGPKLRPNQKRKGVWYIYWTDGAGRSRERSTGTRDREEAHRIFADWLSSGEADAGAPVGWERPRRASQARIAEVLAMYAAEHVAHHTASPKTLLYAIQPLMDWWSERTCDYVRPETCRAYVRARMNAGVQSSTTGRELTALRAALGYAHDNGKLVEDCRKLVEIPQRPPPRDRWLTRDEAARLLWESRRDPHARGHLPLFIQLALRTGARPAALFELQWTQIDFTQNRIDFNPPARKRTSKGRPIISIPRRLRWFLLRAHARAASPFVLAHPYGGKMVPLTTVKAGFRKAAQRAGLGSEVVPYTMRHTAGTWLAQAGVPLWLIGGWLGHSQDRTTELYAHHHPAHMEAARKVMD